MNVATKMAHAAGGRAKTIRIRQTVEAGDTAAVRSIVASSGFFHEPEIEVAVELVEERLRLGPPSGYHFLFAEVADEGTVLAGEGMRLKTVGYTCFGPIPCTRSSFDLYWIAVDEAHRHGGIGRMLLAETERAIRNLGGSRVYVETSSRELYAPTRVFYERNGYAKEAQLKSFYAPDDDKVVYSRVLV